MRIGVDIPNAGVLPKQLGLLEMARQAELGGAESLWVSDHLLMVDRDSTDYPYSTDGRPTWSVSAAYYEAFVCCAMMAAHTKSCRVGTAILVLPQRNVLEVAKVAASLDQLSGGRLVLGLGAGWYELEFEALGYDYASRGRRFDDMLAVLRSCWTVRPDAFRGSEITIPPDVVMSPAPAQDGGPPLLIGGMTRPALRRAARLGDGWLALAYVHNWDRTNLASKLAELQSLRTATGVTGRFDHVLKLHAGPDEGDALPELAAEAQELGFSEVIIEPPWETGVDAALETLAAVRSRVTSGPDS